MLPLSTLDLDSLMLLNKYYRRRLDYPDDLSPTQILNYGDILHIVGQEIRGRNHSPAQTKTKPRRKQRRGFKSLDSSCPGQTIGEVFPANPADYTQKLLLK